MVFERREYVLKLYDTELLHFSAGVSRYGNLYADIIEADEGLRKALPLPLTANLNSDVLLEWMKSRTIPQNRRFVSEILAQAGLTVGDTLGIIDVCKGLAVTDAYWIDHVGGNNRRTPGVVHRGFFFRGLKSPYSAPSTCGFSEALFSAPIGAA